jgi:hypothetical protein
MIADPNGHTGVPSTNPDGNLLTSGQHQGGTRPVLIEQCRANALIRPEGSGFGAASGNEQNTLVLWALFQMQNAAQRLTLPRVTTQPPDPFRGVGNDSTPAQVRNQLA